MSIVFFNNIFHLKSKNSSYMIGIMDNLLVHLYWGNRLELDNDLMYLPSTQIFSRGSSFSPPLDERFSYDERLFMEDMHLEFPVAHKGDYKEPIFDGQLADGATVFEFKYSGYRIENGKPKLDGLPAIYVEDENEAQTLYIDLIDKIAGLKATLMYTIFEEYDIITKSIKYENISTENILIKSALSACVDFLGNDYKLMHLYGAWARERNVEFIDVKHGTYKIESKRGFSSHNENPFIAIMDKSATEYHGNVYGFNLAYSGNFVASSETDSFDTTRLMIGINPFNFGWNLESGTTFQTPEAVLSFSASGIDGMSQNYHNIYRKRLVRGKFRDAVRPILVNNWEGTAQNFNHEKLVGIAKVGSELGLEMFVLDDGWFGKRNDGYTSLGDWYVNTEKLPNGLKPLIDEINEMGLMFGLWFEPEMISPISDLYEKHPDWCLHVESRSRTTANHQLLLDLTRDDVKEYILGILTDFLTNYNIEYVKWDCNRNFTEVGASHLPKEKQCEVGHRYVLGLYEILEALNERFPNVLIEGCSGGGGRFDPGMLYYMPQTWASDSTDPIDRIHIQYGTSIIYPPNSMGAHVPKSSGGINKRPLNLDIRGHVAMSGSYGFELDLTTISEEEKQGAIEQVKEYKKIRHLLQFGTFHRLENPFEGNYASWEFVSENKEEIAVFLFQKTTTFNGAERRVKLKNFIPHRIYECDGQKYSGEVLMNVGYRVKHQGWDYASQMKVFKAI